MSNKTEEATKDEIALAKFLAVCVGLLALTLVYLIVMLVVIFIKHEKWEKQRAERRAQIQTTCLALDSFVVRERYTYGKYNRNVGYRLMQYNRYNCTWGNETLRTYVAEDNSEATNLPPTVPMPDDDKPNIKDTALFKSMDSGLSTLLNNKQFAFPRKQ